MKNKLFAAISVSALTGFAALPAHAVTFATYDPVNAAANISLSGLTLSASAPVEFEYLAPLVIGTLGDLPATLNLTATETGATGFGPIALATFDGSFSLTYTGPTVTAGTVTIDAGDNLLSGTFLGSVFTGYGSSGSLLDSVIGGGLVSLSSDFLTFSPVFDQGFAIGMTSITPPVTVVNGQLTDFTAVSDGKFEATITGGGGGGPTPEPATWALMLLGFGAIGFVARRRARSLAAAG